MILKLHLLPAPGEVTRRQLLHGAKLVRLDNLYWISARLNTGLWVPCCPLAAGVEYREPTPHEKLTAEQICRSGPYMFESGWGSCTEWNAYKAAALTAIYGIQTDMMIPAQGSTSFHCNYLAPWGPEDETADWQSRRCQCPPYHPQRARESRVA